MQTTPGGQGPLPPFPAALPPVPSQGELRMERWALQSPVCCSAPSGGAAHSLGAAWAPTQEALSLGLPLHAWTSCAIPGLALPAPTPSRALAGHPEASRGCRDLAWGPVQVWVCLPPPL